MRWTALKGSPYTRIFIIRKVRIIASPINNNDSGLLFEVFAGVRSRDVVVVEIPNARVLVGYFIRYNR